MFVTLLITLLFPPLLLSLMVPPAHATTVSENTNTLKCVILLHGLARTSSSMTDMQRALIAAGFVVAKIDYPSRTKTVKKLSGPAIEEGLAQCETQGASTVHVVTHSMGGILFRQYVADNNAEAFSRTVMLAPPNQGSEVVDALRDVPGFKRLNGPAGLQIGTDEPSVPSNPGPATSDIAVIAGTSTLLLQSHKIIQGNIQHTTT